MSSGTFSLQITISLSIGDHSENYTTENEHFVAHEPDTWVTLAELDFQVRGVFQTNLCLDFQGQIEGDGQRRKKSQSAPLGSPS